MAAENETAWKAMLMLGLHTGRRITDLATLRWGQINLENAEIQIRTGEKKRRQLILMAPPPQDWIQSDLTPSKDAEAFLYPGFKLALRHKRPSSWRLPNCSWVLVPVHVVSNSPTIRESERSKLRFRFNFGEFGDR